MYKQFRIQVNKDRLAAFFAKPVSAATEAELAELNNLVTIIFNKYYSRYYYMFHDLRSWALLAIFERHDAYDNRYSCYNFAYQIIRNEMGNKISKYGRKEEYMDILPEESAGYDKPAANHGGILDRYGRFLGGLEPFDVLTIPRADIFPLLVFIEGRQRRGSQDAIYRRVSQLLIEVNYE